MKSSYQGRQINEKREVHDVCPMGKFGGHHPDLFVIKRAVNFLNLLIRDYEYQREGNRKSELWIKLFFFDNSNNFCFSWIFRAN